MDVEPEPLRVKDLLAGAQTGAIPGGSTAGQSGALAPQQSQAPEKTGAGEKMEIEEGNDAVPSKQNPGETGPSQPPSMKKIPQASDSWGQGSSQKSLGG